MLEDAECRLERAPCLPEPPPPQLGPRPAIAHRAVFETLGSGRADRSREGGRQAPRSRQAEATGAGAISHPPGRTGPSARRCSQTGRSGHRGAWRAPRGHRHRSAQSPRRQQPLSRAWALIAGLRPTRPPHRQLSRAQQIDAVAAAAVRIEDVEPIEQSKQLMESRIGVDPPVSVPLHADSVAPGGLQICVAHPRPLPGSASCHCP
jgi:hypothetical protein